MYEKVTELHLKTIAEPLDVFGVKPRRQLPRFFVVIIPVAGAVHFVDVGKPDRNANPVANSLKILLELFEPPDKIHQQVAGFINQTACLRKLGTFPRQHKISEASHGLGGLVAGIVRTLQNEMVKRYLPIPGIPHK